jgi:hypothetical protein
MLMSAYLGVAGLGDVGYQFYTVAEAASGSRITAGITDAGNGWYSADGTLPSNAASVRWNSSGTTTAIAREYFRGLNDPWCMDLPDGYPAGSAGKLLSDNLNATVSSRATQTSVDTLTTYVDSEVGAIKIVTDKLDTALELDGAVYRYTTNALEQAPTSGGGGQYAQSEYRSDTATTAASDPGAGDMRWNNATQSLATALYFDDITSNGGDASNVFASIVAGDILTLQQKDSAANVQRWIITSALDNTGWWTLNIAPSLFEGTNIGNNQDMTMRIAHPATTLEEIADAILKRDFSAISGEAAYSLLNAARMLRNKWDTASSTLTVRKEDGTTTAWTRTLTTDPTAQPITGAS